MAKKTKTTKKTKASKPAPKKPAKKATKKSAAPKRPATKPAKLAPKAKKPASKPKTVKKAPNKPPQAAVPTSTVLQAGITAPSFVLGSSTGKPVNLASLAGQRIVLYFYPRADTPGCTVQACAFRDAITSYSALGVPVFGISPDPVTDVTKFAKKFDLNFPLLADEDHRISEAYGVWVEKSMYGKKYWGVARTTFIIAPNGKVEKVFEKVNPDGHDKEILAYLKA
jgi:peroxiredoxin Q/BCP